LTIPSTGSWPRPESWKGITVRHLLSHTSGRQDYPDDYDFRRDYTEDDRLIVFGPRQRLGALR